MRSPEDRRHDELDAAIAVLEKEYDSAPNPVLALDWNSRRVYSNAAYDELIARADPDEDENERLPARGASSPPSADWSFDYRGWMTDRLQRVLGAEILDHGVEAVRVVLRHPLHGPLEALFTGRELQSTGGERLGWIGFAALDPPSQGSGATTPEVHSSLLELHRALDACRKRLQGLVAGRQAARRERGSDGLPELLTEREREVLHELLHGYRIPSIARRLSISHYTVRNHLKSVFKKVGVQSQGELVEKLRTRSGA